MNKEEFINALRHKLSGLPKQDIEERVAFYSEMIDDRIEDGIPESDAILGIGSVEEIANEIIKEVPFKKIAKERIKSKHRLGALEITLLAIGSPIWLSLAVACLAVVISVYAVAWSLIVSAWAIFASFAACGVSGLPVGIAFTFGINSIAGICIIGAGILLSGLAIFTFFGATAATKGLVIMTKEFALGIKKCFIKKEKKQ